ncbi:MAG: hypothetical protein ABTQ28_06580 [Thauera sp.]|jgi:hypothetical protein
MTKIFLSILLTIAIAASADAEDLTPERLCQAAAIESSKFYRVMGELVAANPPASREQIARDLIQASYEKAKSTKLQMPGTEKYFDTLHLWREAGVKPESVFAHPEINSKALMQ